MTPAVAARSLLSLLRAGSWPRVLTVTQPWASAIAAGRKRVETRSWSTLYRGVLYIHAAKGWGLDDRMLARDLQAEGMLAPGDLPRGVIVAVALLADCREIAIGAEWVDQLSIGERVLGNYSTEYGSRYGFMLHDVVALPRPVDCVGALGLRRVAVDVHAAVIEELHRAAGAQ